MGPRARSSSGDWTVPSRRRYGSPEPTAIFGYEAMSLLLSAIERATDDGTRAAVRSQVRAALFDTRDRRSVLGTYSIDRNGDTTLRRYGVYGIAGGQLTFLQAIDALSGPMAHFRRIYVALGSASVAWQASERDTTLRRHPAGMTAHRVGMTAQEAQ